MAGLQQVGCPRRGTIAGRVLRQGYPGAQPGIAPRLAPSTG